MNRKELNEIKKRIKLDKNSITHIYGCYVNANKEIISEIDESLGLMSEAETEMYLKLLRKSLSGGLGRNLMDISFATKQVVDSEEHRLLSALRKTGLQDAALRSQFYDIVVQTLDMNDSNYLVLIAHDVYDVPVHGKDGEPHDAGHSFNYLLCCICPVKTGKAELGYSPEDGRFCSKAVTQVVGNPELGFMFPTFDDRAANIYNALFYSRNTTELHREFIDSVFRTEVPMSAGHQKEAFRAALTGSLDKNCSFEVVRAVHDRLSEMIDVHKESKDPEQLLITAGELKDIIEESGASAEQAEAFKADCEKQFGANADYSPENLITKNKLQFVMPEVKITVDPKFSHLIRTKVINGKKYIIISAENGIELNGININIPEEGETNVPN